MIDQHSGRQGFRATIVLFLLAAHAASFGAPPLKDVQTDLTSRTALSFMKRWPAGHYMDADSAPHWNYQLAVLLGGMEAAGQDAGMNEKTFEYIRQSMDALVAQNGSIPTYDPSASSMDDIALGRQLLLLYRKTGEAKYKVAAGRLRKQLATQPRNASGGFWHTRSFPDQMLLDDEFMFAPFLAEYATLFNEPEDFGDITRQFVLLEEHTRDTRTGLLYQEWNEPHTEAWVSKSTGTSASFWGRGTGWYLMALVDTLPYYTNDNPDRAKLLGIFQRTAAAVIRYQDEESALWYQILDKPAQKGNYLESSAAGMFVYALAKGLRLGYLPPQYANNARRAWAGMQQHFIKLDSEGAITITDTVKGIDLGSAPSHDGSFEYYTGALIVNNDPKGVGAFLLAASESEKHAQRHR